MEPSAILYPVFTLVFLTFAVGFWMGRARFGAVARGNMKLGSYQLRSRAGEPAAAEQAANNYLNLFEAPVLFYALVPLLLVTQAVDSLSVTLAWLFVAARVVHSFIHLTYNNVTHRFLAFATGLLVLLVMWVRFLLAVV